MAPPRTHIDGALALVTGAGSGIGREIALALARRKAHVLAVDLHEDTAKTTAVDCAAFGTPAGAFAVDVADRHAMEALAAAVHRDHGPVDILVNNAGVGLSGRFLDTSLDDWDWIVGVNLMGVVHGCKFFGPAMVEAGRGHVVNLSSGLGYTARPTESAYGATKAAVLHFSQCLRGDWDRHGVGVSVICPGVVNTPIVANTRFSGESAAVTRARAEKLFRRRNYPPSKVADAVVAAIEENKSIVPVSPEARIGWILRRLVPNALGDLALRKLPNPV